MPCPDCGNTNYEYYDELCPICDSEKFVACDANKCNGAGSYVEPVYGPNGGLIDEIVYTCELCYGDGIIPEHWSN